MGYSKLKKIKNDYIYRLAHGGNSVELIIPWGYVSFLYLILVWFDSKDTVNLFFRLYICTLSRAWTRYVATNTSPLGFDLYMWISCYAFHVYLWYVSDLGHVAWVYSAPWLLQSWCTLQYMHILVYESIVDLSPCFIMLRELIHSSQCSLKEVYLYVGFGLFCWVEGSSCLNHCLAKSQ